MARFLSPEWFAEVRRHTSDPGPPEDRADGLVIEQVVRATPDGEVRYRVVVDATGARIVGSGDDRDGGRAPDITITSDWETATAVARGELPAQAALAEGRLRIAGRLDRLSAAAGHLSGQDALPDVVRRATEFEG